MGAMHEQSSWGLDMKKKKEELLTHTNARHLIATRSRTRTAEGKGQEDATVIAFFAHFDLLGDGRGSMG